MAFAYSGLGTCFAFKGDLDKPRVYYKKALAMDPNCIEAKSMLERIDSLDSSSSLRFSSIRLVFV